MTAAAPERLRLEAVCRSFRSPSGDPVPVLRGVSLTLGAGAFGLISGPSGSGKTTLLMIAGLLLPADSGRLWLDDREVGGLPGNVAADIRAREIGLVFQRFCLRPERSALDNVLLRFRYLDVDSRWARQRAEEALGRVGLLERAHWPARRLSAGEMQRVAIARAIAQPPRLLLADEPTGNLDRESAARVRNLFAELHRAGLTILVVTHDAAWEPCSTDRWILREGHLRRA